MKSLTIVYTTSRKQPRAEWFFDSLAKQIDSDSNISVLVIDHYLDDPKYHDRGHDTKAKFKSAFDEIMFQDGRCLVTFRQRSPKPSIWKGPSRITKEDWWSKSNDLNTGIILCETEWIAFCDDRSVLGPHWLQSVRDAMDGDYAVCGSYEKRANLYVDYAPDGQLIIGGELLGEDTRTPGCYSFDSWYGGSGALPLEWCLMVQGFPELADGLGLEDSLFGTTLRNSGLPIRYDSRMRLIEDRTPGQIDGALKRADKNVHLGQGAKSWALVRAIEGKATSQNPYDIRNLRDRVLLNHEDLNSIPPSGSPVDFYDQQPLSEME